MAKTIAELEFAKDWQALHAMWVVCVQFSPLVLCYAVYRLLKPRLIRLLETASPPPPLSTASTSDSAGPEATHLQPPAGRA